MIDRDGRIVFGALLAFLVLLSGAIAVEYQFGISLRDYPLASFLLFAGLAVAAPQLYLAATDDAVSPRARIQFAAVATAVFAIAFAGTAEGVRYLVIATIGAGAIVALACYELLTGYRATEDGSATRIR